MNGALDPRRSPWPLLVAVVAVVALVPVGLITGDRGFLGTERALTHGADLSTDDIELEPVSGLPIVPLVGIGGPYWWAEAPVRAVDPRLRFASVQPSATDIDPQRRRVSLVARYEDHQAARAVGAALAAAVGHPDREAAWLAAAGQPGGMGFDWLGSESVTSPFVQVVDRWLLIDGLAYRTAYDVWLEASQPGELVYRSPLTLALASTAERVLVEGDRSGEGSIAFDAVCRGPAAPLVALTQDLADHGFLVGRVQPPWLAPGVTFEERRARRTRRLVSTLLSAGFLRALETDAEFDRLQRELGDAATSSGDAEIQGAVENIQRYIASSVPTTIPDLGPLADALDPDVLADDLAAHAAMTASVAAGTYGSEPEPNDAERRRRLEPFGPRQAEIPWRSGDAAFQLHLDGKMLSLYTGVWVGVAAGMPALLDHLIERGCEEITITLHDYDSVRAD